MYVILILSLLLLVGMVAGRCLCCSTCTLFSDDFSSDRLSEYTVYGSPTVTGGKLASSGASFQVIPNVTGSSGHGRVTVTVTTDDEADNIELWGAYVDADNYIFLRLLNGEVKLFQRLFGSNTQLGSTGVDIDIENNDIELCLQWNGTSVQATVKWSNSEISYNRACALTGNQVGVLVTGTGNAFFDDLVFKEHYDDDNTCGKCDDDCTIFSDDFSTDLLTTDYTTTGSPTVSGGVLNVPHPASVISLSTSPDECDGVVATFRIKMPDTTKEVDVYLGVNNILRLQAGSPTTGSAKLYFAGSLVDTQPIANFPVDTWTNCCFSIDNSDGGNAVAKFRVAGNGDSYNAGVPAVLTNRALRFLSNAAGTAQIDDVRYYRSEYDKSGCGDCEQGAQDCVEEELIILIYNSNSVTDDNFNVLLNDVSIGTINNTPASTCTGRVFATDTSINESNIDDINCSGPSFDETVDITDQMPVVGENTLRIVSTQDNGEGNFGAVWVGYVSWDGTSWQFCRSLLNTYYAFESGVGQGQVFSFSYP